MLIKPVEELVQRYTNEKVQVKSPWVHIMALWGVIVGTTVSWYLALIPFAFALAHLISIFTFTRKIRQTAETAAKEWREGLQ